MANTSVLINHSARFTKKKREEDWNGSFRYKKISKGDKEDGEDVEGKEEEENK